MKSLFLLLILLFISFLGLYQYENPPEQPVAHTPVQFNASSTPYTVVSVIDGDTIIVKHNDTTDTVRLLGIDTPEVDPKYNPIECYGREATNATKEKLLNQTVFLEMDDSQGERDSFDRILAYVFLPDGTHLNHYLVQEGFAKEYTYDASYKYQAEFRNSETEAKDSHKGLWSKGLCPENT